MNDRNISPSVRPSGPPSLRAKPRRSWFTALDGFGLILVMMGFGSIALHHFLSH